MDAASVLQHSDPLANFEAAKRRRRLLLEQRMEALRQECDVSVTNHTSNTIPASSGDGSRCSDPPRAFSDDSAETSVMRLRRAAVQQRLSTLEGAAADADRCMDNRAPSVTSTASTRASTSLSATAESWQDSLASIRTSSPRTTPVEVSRAPPERFTTRRWRESVRSVPMLRAVVTRPARRILLHRKTI